MLGVNVRLDRDVRKPSYPVWMMDDGFISSVELHSWPTLRRHREMMREGTLGKLVKYNPRQLRRE